MSEHSLKSPHISILTWLYLTLHMCRIGKIFITMEPHVENKYLMLEELGEVLRQLNSGRLICGMHCISSIVCTYKPLTVTYTCLPFMCSLCLILPLNVCRHCT